MTATLAGPAAEPGEVRPRWGVRLARPAFGVVVLAVVAGVLWLTRGIGVLAGIALALALATVVDGLIARWSIATVDVRVDRPDELSAGVASRWPVTLAGWRRPVQVQVGPRFVLGGELAVDAEPGDLAWAPQPRGLVHHAEVELVAGGPLGLVEVGRRSVQAFAEPVPVAPAPVAVIADPATPPASSFGWNDGAPVGEDLDRTIRPYRRGDDRRRVHWKASAHHRELMVRESEGTGIVTVQVVVDLGPGGPAAEAVASAAATVSLDALRRGWRVDLVTVAAADRPAPPVAGRPFRPSFWVVPHAAGPAVTVAAPVRSATDVRRRLAAAVPGRPVVAAGTDGRGRTCEISPEGIRWR